MDKFNARLWNIRSNNLCMQTSRFVDARPESAARASRLELNRDDLCRHLTPEQRAGVSVTQDTQEVFTLFLCILDRTPWPNESSNSLSPNQTDSSIQTELTPRWLELSRSKKINTQVILNPEWKVSEWALKAVPSQRLCHLALPRLPAAEWQPERPLLAPLSQATQTAVATARIRQLAQPKKKHREEASAPRTRPAPRSQGSSRASAHIELLATPKQNHPKFEGEREVCWPVSRSAQKAVASPRVQELSNPKERKPLYEGFNPYIISRAARSACPSARIRQLSLPLPRKCSSQ